VPLSVQKTTAPELCEILTQTGAVSALLVPIQADNPENAAVLWLMSSGPDFGDADSIDFAHSLADQLGQALTLGRAFSRVAESEERHRQLVEAIDGIVWEADATTGRFTYVSPYAEQLLGYPVSRWLRESGFWEKLVHPDDRSLIVHRDRQSYSETRSYSTEYRVIASDGRIVWLHDRIRVLPGADGSVRRLRGMMVDITDRKRIEEERAERLRLSVFNSEVVSALASSGALRDVLHACCEAMVRHLHATLARIYTHDEATSMLELQASAGILIGADGPWARVARGQYMVGAVADSGQPYMTNDVLSDPRLGDPEFMRREGIRAFAGAPMIADGRLAGILAMYSREPLTPFAISALTAAAAAIALGIDRRLAEERLAENRRRLDTFTKVAPLALYAAQSDGERKILWVSDSIERISGFPVERFTKDSQHWYKQIHPEDREAVQLAFAQNGERGVITVEYRWLCADGKYRVFLDQVILVQGTMGSPNQLLGSWLDVTPIREAERALHEREEQLRQTQKMDSIGRLAGGVAHDFNNLMSIVLGYSDLALLTMRPTDPLYPHMSEIHAAGQRASTLTGQLLAFSRKQVLEPQIFNINQVIGRMEQMLHRLIGEDIQLLFEREAALGTVRADPGQFEQVLLNLAVNARDAMPTGGSLVIRSANATIAVETAAEGTQIPPGEYISLSVRDTGCGMNELVRSRLFEPFFTTKKAGHGTGLGLSTVYGIVRQSGGHIRVETAVGKGSTFEVFLPRFEGPLPVPGPQPEPRSSPRLYTETVLLVEDSDAVRRLSLNLLRGQGYHVLEAANGAEALRVAEQYEGEIHLLVTDVIMPIMSGRELTERLTALRPSLRTLYVSGYTDDSVVRHGVQLERVRFLQKPFTLDALATHVRKALDAPPTKV